MRRRLLLPAIALTGAVFLSACGDTSEEASDETASASASETASASEDATADATQAETVEAVIAGDQVGFTASGSFGEKPTLTFDSETPPEGLQVQTVTEGDGAEVAAGGFVVAHYLGAVWGSDETFDNSYDRGAPSGFPLDGVIQGWSTGLVGQTVGSRVLLTIPADLGYGPSGGSSDGSIGAEDTIVFVVDIEGTFDADSAGQADATPTDAEVPVTITGDLGAPVTGIEVTAGTEEPTTPVATTIATGTGPAIGESDQVVLQFAYTAWDNSVFEGTWAPSGTGPTSTIVMGGGSAFDALVGVPVGSRVVLLVPGIEATDTTEATPALAVVVDVLDVIPTAVS